MAGLTQARADLFETCSDLAQRRAPHAARAGIELDFGDGDCRGRGALPLHKGRLGRVDVLLARIVAAGGHDLSNDAHLDLGVLDHGIEGVVLNIKQRAEPLLRPADHAAPRRLGVGAHLLALDRGVRYSVFVVDIDLPHRRVERLRARPRPLGERRLDADANGAHRPAELVNGSDSPRNDFKRKALDVAPVLHPGQRERGDNPGDNPERAGQHHNRAGYHRQEDHHPLQRAHQQAEPTNQRANPGDDGPARQDRRNDHQDVGKNLPVGDDELDHGADRRQRPGQHAPDHLGQHDGIRQGRRYPLRQ